MTADPLLAWCEQNPARAQVMIEKTHRLRLELARRDVNAFCELVGRDEITGKTIKQADHHRRFHEIAGEHKRAVIWSFIESGKSVQLSVLRTLFLLGQNNNARIAIVSNTAAQAKKLARAVQVMIEKPGVLHEIFPGLRPGRQWSESAFTVERTLAIRDPSVQAVGVHGALLGARLDHVVMDDVLDYENTRTEDARRDLFNWYQATLAGRVTAKGTVLVVGTAWHPDDFLHRLALEPGWYSERFPILTDEGQSRWPERWSLLRIEEARGMGALEFARQLLCVARDESDARFKREWIDACLGRGSGRALAHKLHALPSGYRTFTGVDIGARESKGADPSALVTICVYPDETRELLCVETGNWSGPELIDRIIDTHQRYFSIVFVENNAAQNFILQFTRARSAVPVMPFETGKNKVHPQFGVESLAVEMANAKWILPNMPGQLLDPGLATLVDEMLFYTPGSHTGDCLMAAWIAREGARSYNPRKPTVGMLSGNLLRR